MRSRRGAANRSDAGPDLTTRIGAVVLPNPVMTASGTSGHGDDLGGYVDLAALGAVVVKSLAAWPWEGNAPPRVTETPAGMLNSVGLQGAGVAAWCRHDGPALAARGARIVVSIWGRSVADYAAAASQLAEGAPSGVVAVEVNLSCPNVESRGEMFAHSTARTAEALRAVRDALGAGTSSPALWAKLSPNVTDLPAIAEAAAGAGADAVTLVNTVMGLRLDLDARRPTLGGGGGGLSGPAIHPIAVRAVWDVHAALPELPIVGVGGVTDGASAVELVMAGASAVQVGTASFADPRATTRVLEGVRIWCERHGVASLDEVKGCAHGR